MRPTTDSLLEEIVDVDADDSFREESLRLSLGILRHRRQTRTLARRMLMVMIPLITIAVTAFISRQSSSRDIAPVAVEFVPEIAPPKAIPGTSTQIISDEELFALFPGRAVALIGEKGHQKLVFLDSDPSVQN